MQGTESWRFVDGDKTIAVRPQGRFKADDGAALALAAVAVDAKGVHLDLRQESLEDSQERDKIRERTVNGKRERLSEGRRATWGYAAYRYIL
jgi:hypothetical protein